MTSADEGRTRADRALAALAIGSGALAVMALIARVAAGPRDGVVRGLAIAASVAIAVRLAMTIARAARRELPWSRVPFAAIVGLEAIALLLRVGDGVAARVALGLFELGLVAYAGIAARRGDRADADAPLEERLESTLARVLPPRLARVLAMECAIVATVLGGARPAPARDGERAFGYAGESFVRLLVMAYPLLLAGDEALVMALLPRGWIALHVVIAALSAYGWVWLLGVHRSMVQRPHVVAGDVVRVHRGILGSAVLARADIASARRAEPEEKLAGARLDVAGTERVIVTLRRPVAWRGFFGEGRADRVIVSAEDAAGLCAALTAG